MDSHMENIALIKGGMSPEKDVSHLTALAVEKVFKELGLNYFVSEADQSLFEELRVRKPTRAFLAVHGIYGEDGIVPAICEFLKIPYTGSGILSSAVCMDKIFF